MSGETMVAEDEVRLLREAGHDVHMWAPVPEAEGALGLARAGASSVWSASAVQTVKRLIREHRADVVHAHNLFPALSPAVLRAAAAEGAAVVLTLHNYRLLCLPGTLLRDGKVCELCLGRLPWRGVRYRCYRHSMPASAALGASLTVHRAIRTFDRVTRFLAVSRFVRDKYIQAGFPPEQMAVKPNFAWPSPRRSGPGEYFLVLGRLHPEKGVGTVVEAWRDHGAPGRVVVAGDGTEAASLRAAAPPSIEFAGEVPPQQVPQLMVRARALLMPSLWYEAAPRGIVEAYAAGVPVVASRVGALPEAVEDGVSGLLAASGDGTAWAAAARRLADDSESERLGQGAYQMWRERFSPERGLLDLEAAYWEAISASKAS
jgi:glycosyltransferase involved in cell wall biosynthesis